MKTRIVYPKLWFDEKFALCSIEAKLLFLYLITSDQLTLTRYHHITDRQIMFDTGLDVKGLVRGKKEVTKLGWCFFSDNWVYHNHDCAYVDYSGRDRVMAAKEAELKKTPPKVKGVFKGLITRYKPVLNPKPKTINPKPKTLNSKKIVKIKKGIRKKFPKKS